MKTINLVSIILIIVVSMAFLSLVQAGDLGGGGTLGSGGGTGSSTSGMSVSTEKNRSLLISK